MNEREEKIKIKTQHDDENFFLSFLDINDLSYQKLLLDVEEKYSFTTKLAYEDEDNELVSIYSDEEFQIAIKYFQKNNTIPKFKIIERYGKEIYTKKTNSLQ